MPASRLAALTTAVAALAGCSTMRDGPVGISPVGQTLQVVAPAGSSRLSFRDGGVVVATFGERSIDGRWSLQDEELCFNWGSAPRECWPYARPFERGRAVPVTSDRGNVVRVTRL